METWQGVVFVVLLGMVIVLVSAIAEVNRESEEAQWDKVAEDEGEDEDVPASITDVCGRIYKDLDPRRKGRMVRIMDVRHDARGYVCSVLARPSGVISDIRLDRLEDPSRFARVLTLDEV